MMMVMMVMLLLLLLSSDSDERETRCQMPSFDDDYEWVGIVVVVHVLTTKRMWRMMKRKTLTPPHHIQCRDESLKIVDETLLVEEREVLIGTWTGLLWRTVEMIVETLQQQRDCWKTSHSK
jgi:hypothetical protein